MNRRKEWEDLECQEIRLAGELRAFFNLSCENIKNHPPEIAVSYITAHADRIRPAARLVDRMRERLTAPEEQ